MIMIMSALLEKNDSSGTREFTGENIFGCEALCFSDKVASGVATVGSLFLGLRGSKLSTKSAQDCSESSICN